MISAPTDWTDCDEGRHTGKSWPLLKYSSFCTKDTISNLEQGSSVLTFRTAMSWTNLREHKSQNSLCLSPPVNPQSTWTNTHGRVPGLIVDKIWLCLDMIFVWSSHHHSSSPHYSRHQSLWEGPGFQIGWISRKVSRGGVIFNPKIFVADIGNFNQRFLTMKLTQNSNFRVQGMFFSTIVLRKVKTRRF